MPSTFNLFTTSELSTLIKRAPETLVRWRRTRVGPPFLVIEGRVLYDEEEVKRWLESRRIHSTSPRALKPKKPAKSTPPDPTSPTGFLFSPHAIWEWQTLEVP